jgi:hypothetical protein
VRRQTQPSSSILPVVTYGFPQTDLRAYRQPAATQIGFEIDDVLRSAQHLTPISTPARMENHTPLHIDDLSVTRAEHGDTVSNATEADFEECPEVTTMPPSPRTGKHTDQEARLVSMAEAKKVIITLPSGEISITESAEEIFGLIGKAKTLFYRGGRVHEIIEVQGQTVLSPVSPAQFRSRLEDYGRLFAWRKGDGGASVLKPTVCPYETADALMQSLPARRLLPNVNTLSSCPVIAKGFHGQVEVLGPGWHPHNGGIFIMNCKPSQSVEVGEAVNALCGLLNDFDFATRGDRARALASFISPALKVGGWLENPLPLDIGEADASQSGKTYRQKTVSIIYGQTPNPVTQKGAGVGGIDEAISQKLIDGKMFVLFDNIRGKLDSPFLEAILTAPGAMPARVPHRGEVMCDARNMVFQFTSNGAEMPRDLANRSYIVRIIHRPAGYQFNKYAEGDLFAHVKANQDYYLGCVFAVIQAWVKKGCPTTGTAEHSFREWAGVLDWISQNVFNAGPLLTGYEEAAVRISDPKRVWLRAVILALKEANRLSEKFGAAQLGEFACEYDLHPPGVREDADEVTISRAVGKIFANLFRPGGAVTIDGFTVTRAEQYSKAAAKNIPVYAFTAPSTATNAEQSQTRLASDKSTGESSHSPHPCLG